MTDEEIAAIRARLAAYMETQQRVGYVITSDYTTDVPMLLAEVERLRHEKVAMREVVQAVADADNSDQSVCYQICIYRMEDNWGKTFQLRHDRPCIVEQARNLVNQIQR